jgi:hypothetical protein
MGEARCDLILQRSVPIFAAIDLAALDKSDLLFEQFSNSVWRQGNGSRRLAFLQYAAAV